jgi:calcium-dependent protein kinase
VWKLADFGFTSGGTSSQFEHSSLRRGTPGFRAPELLDGQFSNKVDIWAMGCVFHELAVGPSPFNMAAEASAAALRRVRRDLKININNALDKADNEHISNYILSMFDLDPSSRPSASTLRRKFASHCPELTALKRERTGSLIQDAGKGKECER